MKFSYPKILVVEDEFLIAKHIESLLYEFNFTNIMTVHSIIDAKKKKLIFKPDIVLLDVNIEGKEKGLCLARNEFKEERIIFLILQEDIFTINKALELNPVGYLVKPIKKTSFYATLKLASSIISSRRYITIKDSKRNIRVFIDEIRYAKKEDHYLKLYLKNGFRMIRSSTKDFLDLVNSSDFLQVHRSYIINKNYVDQYSVKEIFISEKKIPVSSSYSKQLKSFLV